MRWLSKRIWPTTALLVGAGLIALAQGEIRAGYSLGLYQALSVNPLPSAKLNGDVDLTARLEASASAALWYSPYLDHACLNRLVAASRNVNDRGALKQTEACFARLLAASPLQACSWTSFAYTRHLLGESSQTIAAPLSVSYAMGAREARCMPLRLWTALHHWSTFSPELQETVSQDIFLFFSNWRLRDQLIDIYLKSPATHKKIIENIVSRDRKVEESFSSALKHRLRAGSPPA